MNAVGLSCLPLGQRFPLILQILLLMQQRGDFERTQLFLQFLMLLGFPHGGVQAVDLLLINRQGIVQAQHVLLDLVQLAQRLFTSLGNNVMDVNFFGVAYGYWAALSALKESHGTFLHVSSALAYRGIPLQAAYCSSKAAARTFLESARVELQKHGHDVAISLVLPGAINTPQFDRDRQKLGKQPQPVPPIYQPEPYAEAVLRCAEKPIRELPVSWGAQKLLWGQKLSPRTGDWMLRRIGWKKQHTGEDKPVDSPDNLFETLAGDPGAHGRFDAQAKRSTAWTRLRLLIPKR